MSAIATPTIGRGPEIVASITAALKQSPIPSFHAIEVEVNPAQEQVTLRGTVGSYYYKQLILEAVMSIASNMEIDNQIKVNKSTPTF